MTSPAGVRTIKRYANRKLYDTGSGELTSLSRIEELVRAGIDIRVVDHDSGRDITAEMLAGILASAFIDRPADSDIPLLTALIRDPGELLQAMLLDEQRAEELRAMGDRVRLLSATIDSMLTSMEPAEKAAKPRAGKAKAAAAAKSNARTARSRAGTSPQQGG
jgi:polyhydroxyalkanoate synthesis repressor PhaR